MKLEREEFILLLQRWNSITGGMIEVEQYIYNWDTYSHTDASGKPYVQGKVFQEVVDEYGFINFKTTIFSFFSVGNFFYLCNNTKKKELHSSLH